MFQIILVASLPRPGGQSHYYRSGQGTGIRDSRGVNPVICLAWKAYQGRVLYVGPLDTLLIDEHRDVTVWHDRTW